MITERKEIIKFIFNSDEHEFYNGFTKFSCDTFLDCEECILHDACTENLFSYEPVTEEELKEYMKTNPEYFI